MSDSAGSLHSDSEAASARSNADGVALFRAPEADQESAEAEFGTADHSS